MKRILNFFRLFLRFSVDFAAANFSLARQLVSPKMKLEPDIIEIDTRAYSPAEILALSNMITSIPGTLTLDVIPGERLVVHVLSDPDGSAEAIRERLENPLLEVTRSSST